MLQVFSIRDLTDHDQNNNKESVECATLWTRLAQQAQDHGGAIVWLYGSQELHRAVRNSNLNTNTNLGSLLAQYQMGAIHVGDTLLFHGGLTPTTSIATLN
jgi:hypothetical protein